MRGGKEWWHGLHSGCACKCGWVCAWVRGCVHMCVGDCPGVWVFNLACVRNCVCATLWIYNSVSMSVCDCASVWVWQWVNVQQYEWVVVWLGASVPVRGCDSVWVPHRVNEPVLEWVGQSTGICGNTFVMSECPCMYKWVVMRKCVREVCVSAFAAVWWILIYSFFVRNLRHFKIGPSTWSSQSSTS